MMSVRSLDELAHAVQFVRTGETFVAPRRDERVEVAFGLLHCDGELSHGLGKVETARPAGGLEPFEKGRSRRSTSRDAARRGCADCRWLRARRVETAGAAKSHRVPDANANPQRLGA